MVGLSTLNPPTILYYIKPTRQVGKGLKALYQYPPEFLGFQVEHQPSFLIMSIIGLERGVGTYSFGIALSRGQLHHVSPV
jgi:hypothetical protein